MTKEINQNNNYTYYNEEWNTVENKLKELHSVIYSDIISNTREVFNRIGHYTRKYRGDESVNISLFINEENRFIRIFLQEGDDYIKDELNFKNNKLINREFKSNEK